VPITDLRARTSQRTIENRDMLNAEIRSFQLKEKFFPELD
jgi:hypothetical protein